MRNIIMCQRWDEKQMEKLLRREKNENEGDNENEDEGEGDNENEDENEGDNENEDEGEN